MPRGKRTSPATQPRWTSPLGKRELAKLTSDGPAVAAWIEGNCVYGEGDVWGEPVVLRSWQRDFLNRLYLRDKATGERRYRRAVLGLAKANGKTALAAWIGAYELCAGRNVAPRVIIGAAALHQANLVFGDLKTALLGTTDRPGPMRPYVEAFDLQVLLKGKPGVAQRIAAEAGTNDGARATAFIADELHEWEGRTGRVYMIAEGAVAKRREGFSLAISTAGVIGTDSPLEKLYEHGRQVAQGLEVDPSFLFVWYEPAANAPNLDDPDAWLAAVREANPALGDFASEDMVRHRFQVLPRFEFERYYLNRWTASRNVWIPMEKWDACSAPAEIAEGDTVYVGIDAASKHDNTAVTLLKLDDEGKLHVVVRVFEAPEDEVIDRHLVKEHVRTLCKTHNVVQVLYDPAYFSESAQDLMVEGWPLIEVPQSVPRKIAFSMALYDAVMRGDLRHGGDPVLRHHADGAVAQDRGNGWTLEKLKASRHIDALISTAMPVQAALEDAASGGADFGVLFLDDLPEDDLQDA